MTLMIQATFTDGDTGDVFSETEPYETMYDRDEAGKLYRSLSREYGRCTSKVYRDTGIQAIGWVFESRQEYDDAHRSGRNPCATQAEHRERCTYRRHVWVTLVELVEEARPAHYRAVAIA